MKIQSRLFPLTVIGLLAWAGASGAAERAQRTARAEPVTVRSMYRLTFTLHVIEDEQDRPRQYTLVLEERQSGAQAGLLFAVKLVRGSEALGGAAG